jgi:DNA-binding transcriptional LysR family regulator
MKYCRKAGFVPFVRYRGHSVKLIAEFVANNDGIAFISEHAFENYEQWAGGGRIVSRILADDFTKRTFGMSILKNRMLTKSASDFYNIIAGHNFADDLI